MWKKAAVVAVALALLEAKASTQEVFRSKVDLVVLNVTVIDERVKDKNKGPRFLSGLEKKDFAVYEDGVSQDISFFVESDVPLAIALIVDTSASMTSKMKAVQEAALGFVRNLRGQDYAEILGCNSRVSFVQSFTNDKLKLEEKINALSAGGDTALYNAIYIAIKEFKKRHDAAPEIIERQAIVLLSDGEDTASLVTFDEALKDAQKANVAIYTIFLKSVYVSTSGQFSEADSVMRELATETGGRRVVALPTDNISSVYKEILNEIVGQYTIGYKSRNEIANGKWRRIIVQVLKGGAVARTRKGYDGPSPPKPASSIEKPK